MASERHQVTARLQRGWYSTAPPTLPLRILARAYGALSALRRALYRRGWLRIVELPVPVVVVGNLTVGGTGKTPLAIAIAQRLRAGGWKPGVASRGYGRRSGEARIVRYGDTAAEVGDEPLLIAASGIPVAVAARRPQAARLLLADSGCDVLLADDGLQHYALARDIEVLVVDGRRRFGNGRLLPAGPLREPPDRASDCDLVVANGGEAQPGEYSMQLHIAHAVPLPVGQRARAAADAVRPGDDDGGAGPEPSVPLPLHAFAGRRVHAVAGIGDPARFFDALRAFGIDPVEHAFPDHHPYQPQDLDFAAGEPLLMTTKDAVKCRAFAQPGWYEVPAQAHLPDAFHARLDALLDAAVRRRAGR